MDWIKVKVKHAEYDFLDAPDNVFRSWIMMMMFVAGGERIPTEGQLKVRLGEKNYDDLKRHALHNGYDLRYIMEKVMEDVFSSNSLRRMGKKRQKKYRDTHSANALPNASRNANVTPRDKIRGDKIRVEKIKEITHAPHVSINDNDYNKLVSAYGIGTAKKYIEKLNLYAAQKPKKFKEYASHYATVKVWMDRDNVKKLPPKIQEPAEELRHDPAVAALVSETARGMK